MREELYLEWLIKQIATPNGTEKKYSRLLSKLHYVPFRWSVPMDSNRAADGLGLRDISGFYNAAPCSVLEALVAMCRRCENDIMADEAEGDRTYVWFWIMMENTGLIRYTDANYDVRAVSDIIDTVLDRKYDRYGRGGPFTIYTHKEDIRKVELWYQLNWYLTENFDFNIF